MKAVNVKVLDVRSQTDVVDAMIVASGNSDRHVRAIANHVLERVKAGQRPALGVEGARDGEWVLVDLQDVIVHVMLPRVREFYAIEQLWEPRSAPASSASESPASPAGPRATPAKARSTPRPAKRPRRTRVAH
jgi:ribosome-associated protein